MDVCWATGILFFFNYFFNVHILANFQEFNDLLPVELGWIKRDKGRYSF